MYELVIIVHYATGEAHEQVVAQHIENHVRCVLMGLQRIGKRLGATDIAFRCDKEPGNER